jgi:lysophospholipase L1-like esterase
MTKRVLCFGDSNTWGFVPGSDGERMPADIRWPGAMTTDLGDGFTVIEESQWRPEPPPSLRVLVVEALETQA